MAARLLRPDEWNRLDPYTAHFKGAIPSPTQAQILVVEDGGEIMGFLTMEMVVHVGPCWVRPDHRGRGMFVSLLREGFRVFPKLRGAVCFTNNLKMVSLIEKLGLTQVMARAFKWEKLNG